MMMRRVLLALCLGCSGAILLAQGGVNNIMNLRGKVAADGALAVTPSANGTVPSQATDVIGNLRGKVDSNGNLVVTLIGNSTTATPNILCVDGANQDVCLQRQASGIGNLTAGTAGTTFSRLNFGTALSSNPALRVSGAQLEARLADDSNYANFKGALIQSASQQMTVSGAAGVATTQNGVASVTTTTLTITGPTAFVSNAVTSDITIATTQTLTWITNVTARLTTQFACTAVCTSSTLSLQLGTTAGGTELLASLDADAAVATFGDADAEMGTLNARAAAVQGGTYLAGATAINLRLTSGTGNIGNGTVSNLSGGVIVIYITTIHLP